MSNLGITLIFSMFRDSVDLRVAPFSFCPCPFTYFSHSCVADRFTKKAVAGFFGFMVVWFRAFCVQQCLDGECHFGKVGGIWLALSHSFNRAGGCSGNRPGFIIYDPMARWLAVRYGQNFIADLCLVFSGMVALLVFYRLSLEFNRLCLVRKLSDPSKCQCYRGFRAWYAYLFQCGHASVIF